MLGSNIDEIKEITVEILKFYQNVGIISKKDNNNNKKLEHNKKRTDEKKWNEKLNLK